jgi:hypothetical protein
MFCSFQLSFFVIKCAPIFLKIEEDLNIDGKKEESLEIDEFVLKHI